MTIEEIRTAFIAWLIDHRANCNNPGCCNEPADAVAFLAHSVGIHSDRLEDVRQWLVSYEATCVNCQHLRN